MAGSTSRTQIRGSLLTGLLLVGLLGIDGCSKSSSGGNPRQTFDKNVPTLDALARSTAAKRVTLAGRAQFATSELRVRGNDKDRRFDVQGDGRFSALIPLVSNRLNRLYVSEVYESGEESAPLLVEVIQDSTPPELHLDYPQDGDTLFDDVVSVAGRVGDVLTGEEGMEVFVNGRPAQVSLGIGPNGCFLLGGVELFRQKKTLLTVTARDALGNETTQEVRVAFEATDGARLDVIKGDGQQAPIGQPLGEAVVAQLRNEQGAPMVGKAVTFTVVRSNGLVRLPDSDVEARQVQMKTDANGRARAFWRVGSDAGCGNNRLEVTATDVDGESLVFASALPAEPSQINLGSGNNQRGLADAPLPFPLRAWVSDGCNGVADVPVTFEVVAGDGFLEVPGGPTTRSITVRTGETGHAQVQATLGPYGGRNEVLATFPGNPRDPIAFIAKGEVSSPWIRTALCGVVVDNAEQPIEGAHCTLTIGDTMFDTTSDAEGLFAFQPLDVDGPGDLHVDGMTATSVGGVPVAPGSFPALHYQVLVLPDVRNTMPTPVKLPRLNSNNFVQWDNEKDLILTVDGMDGFQMTFAAGSMTRADGSVPSSSDPALMSLNPVHHDDIPMPMPDGAAPPFAWTLQPAGATFDPPARIDYPNMSGLAPGSAAFFLSFDHDTEEFEIVATAQVSDDGSTIVSDPGVGLRKAGWGCNCPPYSVTADVVDCTPSANGCGPAGNLAPLVPECPLNIACFTPACDKHDICYGLPGANKDLCDAQFYWDMVAICFDTQEEDSFALDLCLSLAYLYYKAVSEYGGDAFNQAQQEAAECADGNGQSQFFAQMDPPPVPDEPPFTDQDGDLLPDDWEVSQGLDPTRDDAFEDPDDDMLVNIQEYIHQLDPLSADTNGDGTSDADEVKAAQPLRDSLDDSWTLSIGTQTVTPSTLGTYRVANISAADEFGPDGPGSRPDFLSDDFLRVVGVSDSGGVARYAFSEPFQIEQGVTFEVGDLSFTDTPPPFPQSLEIDAPQGVIETGETLQLFVEGRLIDGSTIDLTARDAWTVYRTSNETIASVGPDGLVEGLSAGTVFITALNEGAVATRQVIVTDEASTTTVIGRVEFEDGSAAGGVDISLPLTGDSSVTRNGGGFTFNDVIIPSDLTTLAARASAVVGSDFFTGTRSEAVVHEGITDLGAVVLRPTQDVLVFGDYTSSRGSLVTVLQGLGREVTEVTTLPDNLDAYGTVWHVGAFVPLTAPEQDRLRAFVQSGRGLYLTGERPCCEDMNISIEALINSLLAQGSITVGRQGDIGGPFPFHDVARDGVTQSPNLLTTWNPSAPGGIAGIGLPDDNVLCTGAGDVPVGAVWSRDDFDGDLGAIAILVDVNWLENATSREAVTENLLLFLETAGR